MHMLDAPTSGGSEGAAQGTLTIMAGGAADQFQRAMPAFQAMGNAITHVGDIGAGQTVKLVNQILVVVTMLGVAEALLFAQAGGLDLQKTLDAVSQGAAGSWMLSTIAARKSWSATGARASPSIYSRRICAWSWKPPTRWASRPWPRQWFLTCIRLCRVRG